MEALIYIDVGGADHCQYINPLQRLVMCLTPRGRRTEMANIDRAEYAAELKNHRGHNCCQAVTAALADETDMPRDQLKMISTGFCVGMGAMEATCGALIGAGMIAGLKTEGAKTLKYTKQIADEFKKNCGAIRCQDRKGIATGAELCPGDECARDTMRTYEKVMEEFAG